MIKRIKSYKPTLLMREAGVYMVMFAIMIGALIILLALVLGLGIISVNSSRIQNLANVVALSSLEEFVNKRGEVNSETTRYYLTEAALKGSAILQKNRLVGDIEELGEIVLPDSPVGDQTSGRIYSGTWLTENPGENPSPCASYPCFIPAHSLDELPLTNRPLNAIKVEIYNQSNNPLLAPFTKILGYTGFRTFGQATAALVQRCSVYLLDLSESTVADTHFAAPRTWSPISIDDNSIPSLSALGRGYAFERRKSDINDPPCPGHPSGNCPLEDWAPFCSNGSRSVLPLNQHPSHLVCPLNASLFSYRRQPLGVDSVNFPDLETCNFCRDQLSPANDSEGERLLWCSIACAPFGRSRTNPNVKGIYKEDFIVRDSLLGKVYIDLFNRPEPLNSFFLAFNAGMREVRRQSTSGDLALVIPFTGATDRRIPRNGMTPNLDYLTQLTNMDNAGRLDHIPIGNFSRLPVSPNYVEAGWFPLRGTGNNLDRSTHIWKALDEAINALESQCPAIAQKAIILASDGLSTCAEGATNGPCPPDEATIETHDLTLQHLLTPAGGPNGSPSILERLNRSRIVLTTLLAGESVEPHYVRHAGGEAGEFLSAKEAFLYGKAPSELFNSAFQGRLTREEAFRDSALPGVVFREPNLIFGSLSLESGGIFCPLMRLCDNPNADCPLCGGEPCYEEDPRPGNTSARLKDCALSEADRIARPLRICSPFNNSRGEQAANCVVRTLSGNPYILVE